MAKKNEIADVTDGSQQAARGHTTTTDGNASGVTCVTTTTASGPGTRPLRTFRLKGVKASVFENRTEQGAFYKTALQKVYKDGEGWKTTTSLGRDDLPVARLLLGRAWEFILEAEAESRNAEQGE